MNTPVNGLITEAKQIMIPLRDSSTAENQIEAAFLEAEGWAKELTISGKRLAVLFVTFTAYSKEDQSRLYEYFPSAEKALRNTLKQRRRSATALYLTDREPIRYIPGAAILIEEVRSGLR